MAETFLPFDLFLARAELARLYESRTGTLRQALRSAYDSSAAVTANGQIISGTAANGHSVTFSVPGEAGVSPQSRQYLYQYLIELADSLANRDPVPSDAELYADMRASLYPATHFRNDFSALRCV